MKSDFNVGDIVVYDGRLFTIITIYAQNFDLNDPYIYGLSLLPHNPKDPIEGKLLSLRGNLLRLASNQDIKTWEVLYGAMDEQDNGAYNRKD